MGISKSIRCGGGVRLLVQLPLRVLFQAHWLLLLLLPFGLAYACARLPATSTLLLARASSNTASISTTSIRLGVTPLARCVCVCVCVSNLGSHRSCLVEPFCFFAFITVSHSFLVHFFSPFFVFLFVCLFVCCFGLALLPVACYMCWLLADCIPLASSTCRTQSTTSPLARSTPVLSTLLMATRNLQRTVRRGVVCVWGCG